jgi:hypothetical protein
MAWFLAALAFAAAMAFTLWRRTRQTTNPFSGLDELFDGGLAQAGLSVGTYRYEGTYQGRFFQLLTVVDTLAVRKLPSLWLMATRPEPMPVAATFDLVMRPSGPTTFSTFDFLPHTLPRPSGFPEEAVIRSNEAGAIYPAEQVRSHMADFAKARGKELLVSPKGVRIVVQAAEADRARYGVLRQADFGEARVGPEMVRPLLDMLIAIEDALK